MGTSPPHHAQSGFLGTLLWLASCGLPLLALSLPGYRNQAKCLGNTSLFVMRRGELESQILLSSGSQERGAGSWVPEEAQLYFGVLPILRLLWARKKVSGSRAASLPLLLLLQDGPSIPSVMSLGYIKTDQREMTEKEPAREGLWMPGGDGCAN